MARRGEELVARFTRGEMVLDGGLGSMLIAQGLEAGTPPEQWNLKHPEKVAAVHGAYVAAGAEIVTTNTFGATPARLARHGLQERITEINEAGIALARAATESSAGRTLPAEGPSEKPMLSRQPLVAFSVGPSGLMLPPVGYGTEEALRGEFEAQLSNTRGSFDFVLIETMFDVREALVALAVARQHGPVAVSMTYNKTPRGFFTVMGDDVSAAVRRLEDAGADLIGANCSITSAEMRELALQLRQASTRPVFCQPNAGQPRMNGLTPVYDQTPESFALDGLELFDIGVNAVGGCCGTTPDFIRELRTRIDERARA